MPEAYITATRQFVAQSNGWALEELYLDVRLVQGGNKNIASPGGGAFVVHDLKLMGAEPVDDSTIRLSEKISVDLPCTILKWIRYGQYIFVYFL